MWRRLHAACAEVGRDPATLARSATVMVHASPEVSLTTDAFTPLTGSPGVLAAALRAYVDEGVSYVQLWIEPMTPARVAAFAPVLERLDGG